jgi:UDP-GlcNAc:undecaprenyl-phosphate GlcNAc-1-phosphate transferase
MLPFSYTIQEKMLACLLTAFLVTFFLIPPIVKISRAKFLVADPNHRTSHASSIPNLGGLAIFGGVMLTSMIFFNFHNFPKFQYTIAGLLIIFFAGFKDDIIGITPFKKFLAQLAAVLILVVFGDIRITNLHGFLGVFEVSYWVGILITIVSVVGITNCYNLIDGIDGLTSSLGMLVAGAFGSWFLMEGRYNWAMLTISLFGSLLAFFIFNVYGKKYKIFMGDTGSLVLGFIISVIAIQFNELNVGLKNIYAIHAAPAVSIAIIMIPFYDTIRVFLTRIFKNKHPFTPDKTHIHHYILELGFSHRVATLMIFTANTLIIIVAVLLRDISNTWLLAILLLLTTVLFYTPITIVEMKRKKSGKI